MPGACERVRVPADSWDGNASDVKRDFHWIIAVKIKKQNLELK